MHFGGSVVGDQASLINPEISPADPLNFTGDQKVRNLASFSTSFDFAPPTFENAAIYLNSETNLLRNDDRPMSSPSVMKLGSTHP